MSTETEYQGRCFCGAVEIRVVGKPAAMGYCHCTSCRSWSAGPVNAFTLWPPTAVTVTRGAEQLTSFKKTENSVRKWCKTCGGHVLTDHPGFKLIDVYAATIPDLPFSPMLHVNYSETVLRMRDGLPKLKDFPKDLGGSGEAVPE
ncbi:MAG: GFA family protein [Polyangiaceae bacterium]